MHTDDEHSDEHSDEHADEHAGEHTHDDATTLDDGSYDAFVVWAESRDDGRVAFELTITTGAHKGEVVEVAGPASRDPIDLVGLPCTLVVEDGRPRVEI